MNTKFERMAIGAAALAAVVSLTVATPSFAHSVTKASSAVQVSGSVRDGDNDADHKAEHLHASLVATITGVPTTVTDAKAASRGATFVAYKIDSAVLPAAQPTTGGKKLKLEKGTLATASGATTATETGTLKLDAGAAGTSVYYAIYPSNGGTPVVVTVTTDATGATATATVSGSTALTAAYVAPTLPALGEGKGIKGDRGEKNGLAKGHGKGHGRH